ncbi:DUF1778 domain-containing protein [Piscinibacter sp.]|uniref:type II toxin-antitoxin system TacA family antitoxin n=1 Tax=Piscinibacter sp. TaxID=1903157 RepID=UPI002D063BF7|nr:DUF1778 domain-containing protein [Albitalea sp.]HUG22573.1 DUF1778 domain-containing protein [Albitalea sp.]
MAANALLNRASRRTSQTSKRAGARLEFRVSDETQELFKRASEMTGRTMTDFVITAAAEAAHQAIERAEVVRISLKSQECFADALLSPPKPNDALKRAFERRRQMIGEE